MRKYTLVFSIVAHAVGVGALIIVPALATDELPEPRRTSAFIIVKAVTPAVPPPATRRTEAAPSTQAAVPLEPPTGISPEPTVEPVDAGFDRAVVGGDSFAGIAPGGDVAAPPPVVPREKAPVRVGGVIQAPAKLVHVAPIYPSIALAARKEGLVILEAVIDEDGSVREVRSLRPEPLFEEAAITAVRQWRFSPTRLNGDAVPVVMTVTVSFTLNK